MRTRLVMLVLAASTAGLAACNKADQPGQEQNIVIDDGNIPANADIEELPADESSGTPTNELVNGDDTSGLGEANASSNSY